MNCIAGIWLFVVGLSLSTSVNAAEGTTKLRQNNSYFSQPKQVVRAIPGAAPLGLKAATPPLPQPLPPTPAPPDDGEDSNAGLSGKEVYLKECAVCHGNEGEGTERGYQLRFPVSAYAEAVTRKGRTGNRLYAIPMPAYQTDKISDQQLREMWEYLHSFQRPITGKGLFEAYCANCHGQDGRGGFTGEGILSETGEYRKYIRRGKNRLNPMNRRKYMPAYTAEEVSSNDILLLRQYARELRQSLPRPRPRPTPVPDQWPRPIPRHDNDEEDDDDDDDDDD